MVEHAAELAGRLARVAEAVCRHYLPNGGREGGYWRVGDTAGAAGRSLYVRLKGDKAGKWADGATGEHGDLLDLIAAREGLTSLTDTLAEARRFLAIPRPPPAAEAAPAGSPQAARRLFAAGRPLAGTAAQRYLESRSLAAVSARWLRFHPHCFHRDEADGDCAWPALLAAVTDLSGELTGLQRIWLTPEGRKAPLRDPRRSMGALLGNAVRFGHASDVLVAGEGVETVLSVRQAWPAPAGAALSAAHLAALSLSPGLSRLYIAFDDDAAGRRAADRLAERARESGVEPIPLAPRLGDFNEDLQRFGRERLARWIRPQLAPQDRPLLGPP